MPGTIPPRSDSPSTRNVTHAATGTSVESGARGLVLPDGTLAYEDAGTGPLAVMLPGLGDLRSQYRALAPRLRSIGFRTVAVDLRGHGDSSVGWPDYGSVAAGHDLVALIEHLDAGPALVIGNSFGAAPAVWAAAERPDLVRGLVLIGPFVRDHPTPALQRLLLRVALGGPWKVRAWDAYYDSLYKAGRPDDHARHRQAIRTSLAQPGRFEALRGMVFRSDAEIEPRLGEISVPVLVTMGSADPDFPDPSEEARVIAETTGGTVAMIEEAGHYPHLERPEATFGAIANFVRQQLEPGRAQG